MIIFERLGGWGLGNSLFQIATTVAIAKHNNTTYAFPDDCCFRANRFNPKHSDVMFAKELPWINFAEYQPTCEFWGFADIGYIPLPKTSQNMIIDGFFQSEKYFLNCREEILELFDLKLEYNQYIDDKYQHIYTRDDVCCLHVRRGDYATAEELIILNIDYYKKAIQLFGLDMEYVIFSDDIDWCKQNFDFIPKKIFIEERNDLLEMHLMKRFHKHIIANSTYSWWGAWMADNSEVVMPNPNDNWFSQKYYATHKQFCTFEDLICKNWITL